MSKGREIVTLQPTDRVHIRPNVSARQFDGEWIVLDLAGGNYFGLDEMGGAIWQNLTEGKSLQETSQALAARYEAPESIILRDLTIFVNELLERRLVEVSEASR